MRTILITGSSRGIGAATAKAAKAMGYAVILHGRTQSEELTNFAKELDARYIFCDVSDKVAVDAVLNQLLSEGVKINVLVNSAGIVVPESLDDLTEKNYLDQYKVNVLGPMYLVAALKKHLMEQDNPRIINVSSIRGVDTMASARGMAYSASKAALKNLTSALAKELAPKINVNAVAPGFTLTEMSKTWNKTVHNQVKTALLGRAAEPHEIASAIMWLASPEASFITGQTIIVDGGYQISGK